MRAGQGGRTQIYGLLKGKEGEDPMFGKAKASSHLTDERLPPASQLQNSTSVSLAEVKFDGNLLHRSRHDGCR